MTIVLEGIVKGFGEQLVVNKLSLEVQDGELFVLLGSSGSGKSTILRLIAGLLLPDEGRIRLHGRDVTMLAPQARDTGFVFQNYAIFRHMTVAENVEFGLRIRGMRKTERRQRRENLLDLVGLGGFGRRYPHQLSGGQQQRVALARALAYEPAVLLLDEPFGAIDAEIRVQLRRTLKEIQRALRVTASLVTHDQEEAFELGDRIGVLERGLLLEVGTPEDLYYRPKTEFVAKFLGGGNVVVGRAEQGGIRLGDARLPFPDGAAPHEEGAPVRLLFRPEMVAHQAEPFAPGSGVYTIGQGRLTEVLFSGAMRRLRFELETLTGTRPVMPALAYGQRFANIAATESSIRAVGAPLQPGEKRWLGLSRFHVLQPSALKFLVYLDAEGGGASAVSAARQLGSASHGTVTLFKVAHDHGALEQTQKALQAQRELCAGQRDLHIELRSRAGWSVRELVREVQEGYYDLVLLGRPAERDRAVDRRISQLVGRLLINAGIPVMMTSAPGNEIRRILICTAAGEPGKSDVRFSARLARHLSGAATVFHVLSGAATAEDQRRVTRHLEQAAAMLQAYRVECGVKIGSGAVVEAIEKEAAEGQYDLIVLGAPGQYNRDAVDRITQIANCTHCAVLVVPSRE